MGSQLVSLNALAFILILLGFVMFFLEMKFVSYGLLTFGGVATIIAGFYLLSIQLSSALQRWTGGCSDRCLRASSRWSF